MLKCYRYVEFFVSSVASQWASKLECCKYTSQLGDFAGLGVIWNQPTVYFPRFVSVVASKLPCVAKSIVKHCQPK